MYLYMMTPPGNKLHFMGNEIGQFREWDENRPQDFDVLLEYPMHQMFHRFFKDLNQIYAGHLALYREEYNQACFQYIISDRPEDLVYAYERCAGGERILAVFNFGDSSLSNYEIRLSGNHRLEELLCSDWVIYGGTTQKGGCVMVNNGRCHMDLPAYSGRLFLVW